MQDSQKLVVAKLFYKDIFRYISTLRLRASLSKRGVSIGRGVRIQHPEPERLRLQGRLIIGDYSVLVADADDESLKNWGYDFGDMVYIGENCNLRASGSTIAIGTNTMIATGCILVGANHSTSTRCP